MSRTLTALFSTRKEGPINAAALSSFTQQSPEEEQKCLQQLFKDGLVCADKDRQYFSLSPRGEAVAVRLVYEPERAAVSGGSEIRRTKVAGMPRTLQF